MRRRRAAGVHAVDTRERIVECLGHARAARLCDDLLVCRQLLDQRLEHVALFHVVLVCLEVRLHVRRKVRVVRLQALELGNGRGRLLHLEGIERPDRGGLAAGEGFLGDRNEGIDLGNLGLVADIGAEGRREAIPEGRMGFLDLGVAFVAEGAPAHGKAANERPVFTGIFRERLRREGSVAPRTIKCMLEQVEGLDAAVHGVDDGGGRAGHSSEV